MKLVLLNSFEKDYKIILKRGMNTDELWFVVNLLLNNQSLPLKYRDHQLKGKFIRERECHIQPNWLLIYHKDSDKLVLTLTRTGTHSDLFKM